MNMTDCELQTALEQGIAKQVEKAKRLGLPYFQIKCDVCGYIGGAMCEGSSNFDFCDGCTDTEYKAIDGVWRDWPVNHRDPSGSNFQVKELTGMYPQMTEYCYITRS